MEKQQKLEGIYQAHQKGFGFVSVEGEEEDIFIPAESVNGAFQGDTVELVITGAPEGKRREGRIVRILSRGTVKVVGLFQIQKKKRYGFVIPDDQKFSRDIFIPKECALGAVNGHKVVAELTSYGSGREKPEGKIVEILGHVNDPGVDILSIVKSHDMPVEFPVKVMNQAGRIPDAVSEADMSGRRDLRSWRMVTIDGEDARDLDDAVSVAEDEEGTGYWLGVHIADVSNYVQERSALDKEALKRGTSVYLADRVIPMIPHRLSNGICSLNAGEDRLALSCIMRIDRQGNVIDHEICETVICVDERMTYTSVKKILADRDADEIARYRSFVPMFELMGELAAKLRKKRHERGSIDFGFPESKVVLDRWGKPVDIRMYERNVATKMIEEFMLIANETVAEEYFWRDLPFLYRTHETPDGEKIRKLATFINNFGYSMHLGTGEIHSKEIQKLLDKIEGTPEEMMLSRLTLRAMRQAKYTTANDGHFGLAAKYYTHFTSPIRRYPDLQIHRIIKDNLRGRMNEKKAEHYRKILPEVAEQASMTERRAEEAERETLRLKKAEYMEQHLGEVFAGVISGITSWGVYVELENTVEGLVHVTNMYDDHYDYYDDRYEMVGEHTRKVYQLGQPVYVRVIGTDRLTRTIDFEFAKASEQWEQEYWNGQKQ